MGFENGKLVRVVLRATIAGDQQVNTFHYDLIDSVLSADNDPQTLADRFRDDVRPAFAALYTSAWQIEPVEVVMELDPQDRTAPRSAWGSGAATPGTKTVSSDLMPRAACAVAQIHTENIGRRARGRLFIGGSFQESDQSNGTWSGAIITLMETYMNAAPLTPDLASGASDAVAHRCVYSRTSRAESVDPYAPAVTFSALNPAVRWLRTRQL